MSDQSPLIVPIVVEALVVNDAVRTNVAGGVSSFLRSSMQYSNLAAVKVGSAQPFSTGNGAPPPSTPTDLNFTEPGDDEATPPASPGITYSDYYNGIYLKWRLPTALTRGSQQNTTGTTEFPIVPNRWLVVRYGGDLATRQPAAWIIESDYVWPAETITAANLSQVGSLYMSDGPTPSPVYIGQNFPLATESWSEPGTSLSLTAVAPGNPAFAFNQPDCNNVFSFIDAINAEPAQTMSYMVLGWYSDAADDPLAPASPSEGFRARLESLQWALAPHTDREWKASWSLFYGFVTGVAWPSNAATSPPLGGVRVPLETPLAVAVGNTSVEALTALIANQAAAANKPHVEAHADLLEALQLDLLDVLDQPDGQAVLAEHVHHTSFQKYSGGYRWRIVDAPGVHERLTAEESAWEAEWLAALNDAQAALDEAQRELTALQIQLYVMWWKYEGWGQFYKGETQIEGLNSQTGLQDELDPSHAGGLAQLTASTLKSVRQLAALVPGGATPEELQAAITAYAEAHQLTPGRVLKRANAPRYYLPNNPVVMVAGAGASGIVESGGRLLCRFPSQLVNALTIPASPPLLDESQTVPGSPPDISIPQPDLSGVSGVPWSQALAASLIEEFFLLDPNNATMISAAITGSTVAEVQAAMGDEANYNGVRPAAAIQTWTENPWHPLFLYWTANYYPITYGTPAAPNWTFDDGQYYWNGSLSSVGNYTDLGGRIQLTPAAALNMGERIRKLLRDSPHLEHDEREALEGLLHFIKTEDEWDFLSQALDAFNDQLLLRQTGVFLSPQNATLVTDPSLPTLIGGVDGYPPNVGDIPASSGGETAFAPWRCGQFVFTFMAVVDEWGQALNPITASNCCDEHGPVLYLPPDLTPELSALDVGTAVPPYLIQLPPQLLQPARLNFDLIAAAENLGGGTTGAEAVSGWVLPNHLDNSLMAYDARGRALGEMSVGVEVSGARKVCWTPAPGSPYRTLLRLATLVPVFGPFLLSLREQGPEVFADFLAAIDETMWTTAPLGSAFDQSLTALIGRPLALVSASLQFELDGPPYLDPSWQYTFTGQTPAVNGYQFAIQLGNVAQLEDGLVGYFVGDDYGTFNVVQQAGAAVDGFLQTIGENNNYLYLPFDGETSVNVSMLVDPRAAVHATTAILPTVSVALPGHFVSDALDAMKVTFRVDGILTDRQSDATQDSPPSSPSGLEPAALLMPTPKVKSGTWSWVENEGGSHFAVAPNDTTARLSNVLPVLRRGLLQLSSALDDEGAASVSSPPDSTQTYRKGKKR